MKAEAALEGEAEPPSAPFQTFPEYMNYLFTKPMEKLQEQDDRTRERFEKVEKDLADFINDTSRLDAMDAQILAIKAATQDKDTKRLDDVDALVEETGKKLEQTAENLNAVESFLKSEKKIVSKIQNQGEKSLGKNIY